MKGGSVYLCIFHQACKCKCQTLDFFLEKNKRRECPDIGNYTPSASLSSLIDNPSTGPTNMNQYLLIITFSAI